MTGVMEIASLPCHSGQGARMTLSMLIQVLGSIDCHCASVRGAAGEASVAGSFARHAASSLRLLIFSNQRLGCVSSAWVICANEQSLTR
ncbi:Uncharacterised protein [Salmonella enterica subsp. enterica serovar Bovismorbificans]|uniref:Uncharacterized protein n=1 Tax=Salmonella enterica subsp. enterica serovar Bovismorbificans TaxID=58097 RepID=A0A655BSC2_SALET|nr:Uncharacterised protein [Salmonella enterica subsp. enterica serovar Bovismorbificans]